MKKLMLVALLVTGLSGCGLGGDDYVPTPADFSGKVFNAAFPDGSPILSEMTPADIASLKCQFVFNLNSTGTAVFKMTSRTNTPSFSWRVQNDSLVIRLSEVDNRFAVKKLGDDYELFNRTIRFVLYKPKS